MVESITNIETIKALAVEPQFNNKWENLLARYVRTTFENLKFHLVLGGFSSTLQCLSSLCIMWYGGHMVMDGEFTLGQLIAFQMISGQAIAPMTKLLTMWPQVQQVGLSLERIGDIFNTAIEPVLMDNIGKRANRAMLIIAHRLSTVRRCDRIIVVDKGEIIEEGSHDELMAAKGAYYNLYSQQEGAK